MTFLFKCFIGKLIYIVKLSLIRHGIGIQIGKGIISMIYYVDDIVLISESEEDIQRTMSKIKETFEIFKMKINKKGQRYLFMLESHKI